ncbi:HD domain-containing protein [Micromonospora sagamiensis]|uniref:Putative hydrolase of HD superfamily n=1 Tax=Micromonospora sagamiensis TaxID=47875 RepID=A0A562WMU0_9ACTN|nr:HD domain-containing protein [Micromonospora sagamiensis]TWJ31431.1 putative hydrolase of HD superfamily [Micromonospora sagamiensis]BCL15522.1 haloacid dehalogenase [Micromonospora sagamiensis]
MSDDHDAAAMRFIFEAGVLKRAARTGWWFVGVKHPESIAEHSHRTALIGMILAAMEGADPARVTMLCVLHDTQETRITDIPHIAKRYLAAAPNTTVTADQVADCPPAVIDTITAAVTEYETGETREAIVARDADKLECLVQAVEYRHQGFGNVQRWIDSSRAALKTASAHRLADAALTGQPLGWLTPAPKPE